ncbi:MAG TPA: AAA family ATPase [Phycisphaerae bacterium]|nr:AAA family ATPase [Phycisphaerae bacterium]
MNTLLVHLYGAPCSGKSVKMMQLGVIGKLRRHYCEICPEVAKEYVVQHIEITREVQWNLTREQQRRQLCFVGHVEVLITDAPILIGGFYSHYRNLANLEEIDREFGRMDAEVRAKADRVVNVYMWRDHPYDEAGRLESECEDEEIARRMWEYVKERHAGQTIIEARSTESPEEIWERIITVARRSRP